MNTTGLISTTDAMNRLRCTALRLGEMIDAGLIGAFHDRVSGAWQICEGSLVAFLRKRPTDADLDAAVRERAEARQAEVIRLSERTWRTLS